MCMSQYQCQNQQQQQSSSSASSSTASAAAAATNNHNNSNSRSRQHQQQLPATTTVVAPAAAARHSPSSSPQKKTSVAVASSFLGSALRRPHFVVFYLVCIAICIPLSLLVWFARKHLFNETKVAGVRSSYNYIIIYNTVVKVYYNL